MIEVYCQNCKKVVLKGALPLTLFPAENMLGHKFHNVVVRNKK